MKTATVRKEKVSVIIPAYNEEFNIERCLKFLQNQDFKNIEVIVIDDFSSDKTGYVVKAFAKSNKMDIKVLRNTYHKERSASRNIGANKSIGKYLLFLDSDMHLNKNIISDCIKLVNNDWTIKAVIIPEESIGKGFWAQCRHLEKKCYLGDDNMEAARFFEKDAFCRAGGWDIQMISGEDWDLTKRFRFKYKIGRINTPLYHNEGKLTLWRIVKKKFYYASKAQSYLKKYPINLRSIVLFIFRPAYFRNWRLFLSDPIHGSGVLVLKVIEMLVGGIGFLYSKIPSPL